MASSRHLLLASASEADRRAISALLSSEPGCRLLEAATGAHALQTVEECGDFLDLVLLDASLQRDGAAVVQRLRVKNAANPVPVMLLLHKDRHAGECAFWEDLCSETLEMPPEPAMALRRIRLLLELHERRQSRGGQRGDFRRPPAGLLNGAQMAEAVARVLCGSGNRPAALLLIAVDDMQLINELNGHRFGDQVLADAADAIAKLLPKGSLIARPQGDMFCALLSNQPDHRETARLLETLKRRLCRRYPAAPAGDQTVTACIGAAMYPDDGQSFPALDEAVRLALRAARQKGMGRDNLVFFTPGMRAFHQNTEQCRHALGMEVRNATAYRDVFIPVVGSRGEEIWGYDYILLPDGPQALSLEDVVRQASRLPAKSAALLFRAVMHQAFATLHGIEAGGVRLPNISIYAVLPPDQTDALARTLREMLLEFPVDPTRLCVNVPQEMIVNMSHERVQALVRQVRALGFRVGIYHVGCKVIPSVCFDGLLFDRVLFSPDFVRDLLRGVYPPAFSEWVLPYFSRTGTVVCFPTELPDAERVRLLLLLQSNLCSYRTELASKEAFCAHLKEHRQREMMPRPAKRTIAFRMSLEQYEEIFEKSGVVIFDWQPHNESIVFSETFHQVYGASGFDGRMALDALTGAIHPDDQKRFVDLLLSVKHGQPYGEGVYRVRTRPAEETSYRWRRYNLISIVDEQGVVMHVYGISFDVDRERQEVQDFKRQAETDPLTGLLNRGATEMYIQAFLESEGRDGKHALMLIDVDNFKTLNDRLGHIAGDEALRMLSAGLKTLFRSGDVVGRIGGDEFVVFLKHIESEAIVAARADHACRLFREANAEWLISATIGVARYPKDGDSFHELYAKADIALYDAKGIGKDQWAMYAGGK